MQQLPTSHRPKDTLVLRLSVQLIIRKRSALVPAVSVVLTKSEAKHELVSARVNHGVKDLRGPLSSYSAFTQVQDDMREGGDSASNGLGTIKDELQNEEVDVVRTET